MLKNLPQLLKISSSKNIQIPKFTFRQLSDYDNIERLRSKTKDLLENSVTTDDDLPDEVGPGSSKKKKARHPKREEKSAEPGVDLSNKSVILFPGQGAQFVGMGARLLDTPCCSKKTERNGCPLCRLWSCEVSLPTCRPV